MVIKLRHLKDVQQSARRATLWIGAAKYDPTQSGMNDRPGTHRAWFLCNKQIAVREPPILDHALSLRDGEHFRVGGCILQRLNLVPRSGDNFTIPNDDCADRDLARGECLARKSQSLAHKKLVAGEIPHGTL